MTESADVVVVGAGIIGASIAFQLARHGLDSVTVIDKGAGPGEGSTGASSSISRCRYTHPEVIRAARDGQIAFAGWKDFLGLVETRAGFNRVGVLWMMGERQEETAHQAARLMAEGVDAEALDLPELNARFPMFSGCAEPFDLTGSIGHVCSPGVSFLLEPGGGYVDPVSANQDLIEASRALGVSIRFGSKVSELSREGGRMTGVRLGDGSRISAGLVINAAGPWCNQINALAGYDHRWTLTPTRIQTVHRTWPSDFGALPIGVDSSTGIYFRPESGGRTLLIGSIRPEDEEEAVDDPDAFKRSPDAAHAELVLAAFHHAVPGLEARGTTSGIAGLYTINRQDVHPIVGPTGIDGFWVANGFSGHGFKLAPTIGSMIARALTGLELEYDTVVDMGFFAADREPIDVGVKHVLA